MAEPMSEGRVAQLREDVTQLTPGEVKELLAEVDRLRAALEESDRKVWRMRALRTDDSAERTLLAIEKQRDEARVALGRVKALHFETESVHTHTVCEHRYCIDDSGDQHRWPCPTSVAAGEQTEGGDRD